MELLAIPWLRLFLPSISAVLRHHHQKGAIIALNVLLGWTVLGWAIAMIWSYTRVLPPLEPARVEPPREPYRHPLPPPEPRKMRYPPRAPDPTEMRDTLQVMK
jgi:hypothetical protein